MWTGESVSEPLVVVMLTESECKAVHAVLEPWTKDKSDDPLTECARVLIEALREKFNVEGTVELATVDYKYSTSAVAKERVETPKEPSSEGAPAESEVEPDKPKQPEPVLEEPETAAEAKVPVAEEPVKEEPQGKHRDFAGFLKGFREKHSLSLQETATIVGAKWTADISKVELRKTKPSESKVGSWTTALLKWEHAKANPEPDQRSKQPEAVPEVGPEDDTRFFIDQKTAFDICKAFAKGMSRDGVTVKFNVPHWVAVELSQVCDKKVEALREGKDDQAVFLSLRNGVEVTKPMSRIGRAWA